MVSFGKQGLSIAATAAVTAAVKASYFYIILSLFESDLSGEYVYMSQSGRRFLSCTEHVPHTPCE